MGKTYPTSARIAVKLLKSIYGHPLLTRLQKHLATAPKALGGVEIAERPSNWMFHLRDKVMVLNVYVDDLTLARSSDLHSHFWQLLCKEINLEPEAEISSEGIRILGRLHRVQRTDDRTALALDMGSYAQQVVDLYVDLTGVEKDSLKVVPTPCLAESAMTEDDLRPRVMQSLSAKVLMKSLWLARCSRPDVYFVVSRLASFVA